MYITEVTTKAANGKSYKAILLRESYREDGKVKNRTIANLTKCKPQEIAAIRLALQHKDGLSILSAAAIDPAIELIEGKSIGAAFTVYQTAKSLGIEKALGTDREGKLALWQVIARVIDQGSRLSAVRLADSVAGPDIVGIREGFCEDDLYKNLTWLATHQREIEQRLFKARSNGKKPELFLYDVTSSYFEGEHNELSDWGYNRDKKRGKKQLVIGLLCDEDGLPITIELFTGNTNDLSTFQSQIQRAAQTYGCQRVTFVGDRGMIKSQQIKELQSEQFHYITAITKAQIDSFIKAGIFQMSLFDDKICEVENDGVRYLLRRNPQRAEDIAINRAAKTKSIEKFIELKNAYLNAHPKASIAVALSKVSAKIARLKLNYLKAEAVDGNIVLRADAAMLAESSRLDGCYVIKTDLPKEVAATEIVHDRYKDLAKVEQAFRTSKTALLEMRPWFVWTQESTRGHAFVVMLAYLIANHLHKAWSALDVTVAEGLNQLSTLCSMEVRLNNSGSCHSIPTPRPASAQLLVAAGVTLPKVIPILGAAVVTRKKLSRPASTS